MCLKVKEKTKTNKKLNKGDNFKSEFSQGTSAKEFRSYEGKKGRIEEKRKKPGKCVCGGFPL